MTVRIEVSRWGLGGRRPAHAVPGDRRGSLLGFIRTCFLSRAFAKFLCVGVVNALDGIVLAWLYSLFLQANVAFIVGYLTSVTISFYLNSWIVFPSRRTLPKYFKFVLSYVPNFLVQNLCVIVVYNMLHLDKLIAYVVAAIVGVPVTFLLLKFFAFREKPSRDLP